jgi:hypothetical protein
MDWNEIRGLKYYIAYATLIIGLFIYSNAVGWNWLGSTSVAHEKGSGHTGTHRGGVRYFYHK